jgi:hypothetical protein
MDQLRRSLCARKGSGVKRDRHLYLVMDAQKSINARHFVYRGFVTSLFPIENTHLVASDYRRDIFLF